MEIRDRERDATFEHFDSEVVYLSKARQQPHLALILNRSPVDDAILRKLGHSAQPVTATYTSWWRDRLLYVPERNGTFVLTFIENLQQASSDDRILHNFANMFRIPRINNSSPPARAVELLRSCRVESV